MGFGAAREDEARHGRGDEWAARVAVLLRLAPQLCGGLSFLIGAVVLMGWLAGSARVASIFTGLPVMVPSSALLAILAGSSLFLLGPPGASRPRAAAGRLLAAVASASAVLILIGYASGFGLAIHRVLGIEAIPGARHPGSSSPQTAAAFACVTVALLALERRTRRGVRPAEILALVSALIALAAVFGYLFEIAMLYEPASLLPYIGISVPTAFAVLALSFGVLAARADAGVLSVLTARDSGGTAARALLGSLIAFSIASTALVLAARQGVFGRALAAALIVLFATVGGSAFILRLSRRLSRLDAERERAREETRSLFEQAPDGIFTADLEGRYTGANRAGCRMLGYEREEIVGKTIGDLIPRDRVGQLDREREQLLRGERVVSEWELRKKDGSWLPVEVSAKILKDGRWQGFVRDISVRRRLEAALRESHADLVRAQSVAHVGSWRLDVRRNVLAWSDEAYWIFGVPAGTPMTYDAFLATVHPDDREYVHERWSAGLRGEPYDIEHRIIANGEVRWVREKADLEFDANHALVGGIGVTLDITDRKSLETELRLAEAKASGILSISADGIISIDEAQRITLFNKGAEKIFGYAAAEVLGAPLDTLIPERLRGAHRWHVDRFAAGAEASRRMGERTTEIVGLRKNGEEFPADAAISKLDVGGTRILTVALRDVKEQKELEDRQRFLVDMSAVLASTLDYEATLSNVAEAAVRKLADLCLVDVVEEDGEVRRLKVAVRDPAKAWLRDAFSGGSLDRSRPHLVWSVLQTRKPTLQTISPEVIAVLSQSEEQRHALETIGASSVLSVPMLAAGGKLVGAIALLRASPARPFDAREQRLAEELGYRAALSIENARLYRAAERAIRMRDDVLGIVAHDLRNPLATVMMQANLLQRGLGAEPSRRSIASIERAATRMNRLIQDLLDVARLEAGKLTVERERTDARRLVCDSVESLRPLAESASLELALEIPSELPDLWGDRDRLLQVLENLVGNAIKFTEPGGRVIVGASPQDGEVLLRVTDTGAGIAPADLPRLFDRFWKAKATGRAGAGLGLAIARGIVEAHGGRIWVESAPGRGSTFLFTIPSAPRPAEARQEP